MMLTSKLKQINRTDFIPVYTTQPHAAGRHIENEISVL